MAIRFEHASARGENMQDRIIKQICFAAVALLVALVALTAVWMVFLAADQPVAP